MIKTGLSIYPKRMNSVTEAMKIQAEPTLSERMAGKRRKARNRREKDESMERENTSPSLTLFLPLGLKSAGCTMAT